MPSDFALKTMNALHRVVHKASFGKLGWRAGGMAVVELTTIGRKSGQPRTVILTSPLKEDGAYVVVASKGGNPENPAWFLNLRDNPEVEVVFEGRPKTKAIARIATPEERARLWPQVTSKYKGYGNYQKKTDREIPLVFLTEA